MNEMMMSVGDVMRKAVRWERGVRMWWIVLRRRSSILGSGVTRHVSWPRLHDKLLGKSRKEKGLGHAYRS